MCEVTRQNFEEKYHEIISDLHSASYISVDCEFTGLFEDGNKCSLFDSPKIRFSKLQNCLEKYTIIQFGLSTFKYERKNNSFTASTYNFHLIPTLLSENQNLTYQIGSIEFLCKHKFDFNKSFYDGIYYLNKSDEAKALRMIEDESIINEDYGEEIQRHCSAINEWIVNSPESSEMFLQLDNQRQTLICLLHQQIRKRFPQIWTYFDENGIKIKKVNDSEKRESSEEITLKKRILDSLLGFSRIIKEIQNLKKPIIGHNFLPDLIKIYQQFYNPQLVSYSKFKREVNDLFPNLYDTKHMSFKLRELLRRRESWQSNCLSDLYKYFRCGKGASLVICTPWIYHKDESYEERGSFHEAGFDSFITGFCFLKMAHAFSLWNAENKSFQQTFMQISSSWLLGAVVPLKNRLNISRGQVNHIIMDGPDPRNTRPELMYIQSRKNEPLAIAKVSESIAKYGSIDIQPINKYSAIIAVANQWQLNEIVRSLENTEEFIFQEYNFFKHSFLGRTILSGVIGAFAGFAAIITLKGFKKS